jgi:ABC-type branched-subunit amino acid transport system substrate-binding protein
MGRRSRSAAIAAVCALAVCVPASFARPDARTADSPGVTSRLITLGLNVAQSGQAAPVTQLFVQGIQTFWYDQNKRGGVCGRQVKLVYGDNAGNPQQALTVYSQVGPQVLAFQQLSPSGALLALAQQSLQDKIVVSGSSTVSALFGQPNYVALPTDYGHAALDTIDWLIKQKKLKAGDTVALLHGVGAYGDDAKAGFVYAAQSRGLKTVTQQVAATDTDMSGPMLAFKQAGATVALLIALAPQDNNAIAAADAIGYQPTIIAASYLSSALDTSIGGTLKSSRYYVLGNGGGPSIADLSSDSPLVKRAIQMYTQFFHQAPTDSSILLGYAQGYVYKNVMQAACGTGLKSKKNPRVKIYKSLTRQSFLNALVRTKNLDMQGLLPDLNFANTYKKLPPTLAAYLSQVDTSVPGTLKAVTNYFTASDADKFKEATG